MVYYILPIKSEAGVNHDKSGKLVLFIYRFASVCT